MVVDKWLAQSEYDQELMGSIPTFTNFWRKVNFTKYFLVSACSKK